MTQLDFSQQLAKQQQRKQKARLSSLKRTAEKKYPLFAEEFVEHTIQKNPAYYEAKQTQYDIEVLQYKIALKTNPNADIDNFITQEYKYCGINYSYNAMNYRDMAKQHLSGLEFFKCSAIEFHSYRKSPAYRADYWYQILIKARIPRDVILSVAQY